MENQQQQQQSGLCRAGCGFYGSAVTEGLCSKCFKDSLKRTQETIATPRINQNVSAKSSIPNNVESASTSMDISLGLAASVTESHVIEPSSANLEANSSIELERKSDNFDSTDSELLVTARDSLASLKSSNGNEQTATSASNSSCEAPAVSSVKKPNRCHTCKKRVGLTGFVCRCGGLYCSEHRYDKAHDCVFDYKTMEREEIRKNNPMVVSDKIQRI